MDLHYSGPSRKLVGQHSAKENQGNGGIKMYHPSNKQCIRGRLTAPQTKKNQVAEQRYQMAFVIYFVSNLFYWNSLTLYTVNKEQKVSGMICRML